MKKNAKRGVPKTGKNDFFSNHYSLVWVQIPYFSCSEMRLKKKKKKKDCKVSWTRSVS